MRSTLRMLMVPAAVVVLAASAGCSSGVDDAAKGKSAEEICGAIAKNAPASTAFKAIAGEGNLEDTLAEPDRLLKDLRAAALEPQSGKTRMKGIPFCWPRSAKDGKGVFMLTFREALALPGRSADDEKVATFFATGEQASSSDYYASVYFKCRMKAPAHEILIDAELERADENEASEKSIRVHQITVANAAARKVAADLGCQNDTKLVSGVPTPTPAQ
ncbi:hypothetical protein [Streptomyces sp. NPDC059909]|uniref:hypothetical protein n=1 Tax=Streptomyces sp. NPDC059909 TaxID=3346998 RepID=UPI00365F2D2D